MTRQGPLAGIIAGGASVLIWDYIGNNTDIALFGLYELLPGFIIAALTIYIVSKMTTVGEQTANQFEWYSNEFKKYKS